MQQKLSQSIVEKSHWIFYASGSSVNPQPSPPGVGEAIPLGRLPEDPRVFGKNDKNYKMIAAIAETSSSVANFRE